LSSLALGGTAYESCYEEVNDGRDSSGDDHRRAPRPDHWYVAWLYFVLTAAHVAAVVAAGAAYGNPKYPYWAIAEVIVVVGSPILVILVAAIHDSAPRPARVFTLVALGWMLIMAALTITV